MRLDPRSPKTIFPKTTFLKLRFAPNRYLIAQLGKPGAGIHGNRRYAVRIYRLAKRRNASYFFEEIFLFRFLTISELFDLLQNPKKQGFLGPWLGAPMGPIKPMTMAFILFFNSEQLLKSSEL